MVSGGPWAERFPAGTVLPWLDSMCLHMVAGTGPAVSLRVRDEPVYRRRAVGRWTEVQGYAGVPLLQGEDELFGTVSGFTGSWDDQRLVVAGPTLCLLGGVLSAVLSAERVAADLAAELDVVRALSETDVLTGLRNRLGWQDGLDVEAGRCDRYGEPAGVVAVDLDALKAVNDARGHAAGDALLNDAAVVLQEQCRPTDIVARPGGDEFAVLAVGIDAAELHELAHRIEDSLAVRGIAASVAAAPHSAGEAFSQTWARADLAMYARKHARRVSGGGNQTRAGAA